MKTLSIMAAITLAMSIVIAASPSEARRHKHKQALDANGNTTRPCTLASKKTGAKAVVGCAHVAAFQAYIDDLEGGGATVYFMGGTRRGKCWSGGLHPCGKALDVCQLSRGRVAAKCHLPGRSQIAAIAARHNLFEGGQWCNSDYGHVQVGVTAGACGTTLMARSRHRSRTVTAAIDHQPVADWRGY